MMDNKWIVRDMRTGRTATFDGQPNDNQIKIFKDSLGYSAVSIELEDRVNRIVEFIPVDLSA